jgi:hypothetical protein
MSHVMSHGAPDGPRLREIDGFLYLEAKQLLLILHGSLPGSLHSQVMIIKRKKKR